MGLASEDFLSLNVEAFKHTDSDHIKNLRKNFAWEAKNKKKETGFFKSFSRGRLKRSFFEWGEGSHHYGLPQQLVQPQPHQKE
jgi:hypothetical protein